MKNPFSFRRSMIGLSSVALVVAMSVLNPAEARAAASGSVDCGNGQAVQGVWMNAGNKSGWARITAASGFGPNHVNWYRAEVSQNSWYSIHVGCGSWSPTYVSDYTNVHSGDFVCVRKVSRTSSLTNKCWDS